jgi:hypothetical protein
MPHAMSIDMLAYLIAVFVGMLSMASVFSGGTLGGPLSHGRGQRKPITFVGRLIFFAGGLMATIYGVRGLLH